MKIVPPALTLAVLLFLSSPAIAQSVVIAEKPVGLTAGVLNVAVEAAEPVERIALLVNGVPYRETAGRSATFQVDIGYYVRRLRMRAVGYDAEGRVVGEDEMVVNDPRPPFRVSLQGPRDWPEEGPVELHANVIRPSEIVVREVEFFVGEQKVATDGSAPYRAVLDASRFPDAAYARVVARGRHGEEANGILFFGDRAHAETDVTIHQIPLSVAGGKAPLRPEDVTLLDNGVPRLVEKIVAADDQPLHVILLIDYSESMLEELPVVKKAAKEFARALLRPQDRLAVVGFNQRAFWLTGYTNDWNAVADAVDRVKPIGQTHLYDSTIQMLYELQKTKGRHALVVLTDGVDQGSRFKLEHLVHYARYAGVPIYPVIKNQMLSRWMRLGIGRIHARRLEHIAHETGATYFIIRSERELEKVYGTIAAELRQQFLLVFHSEPDAPDQWRPLKAVSSQGHNLRLPRGYFP